MKQIIVVILILLAVLTVACQPQAKVVPIPDKLSPVAVQESGAILYINNTNLNQTSNLEINPLEKNNNS